MKRMVWLIVLMLVCLTACGTKSMEAEPEPEKFSGAPLYESPAEEPAETVQVEFVCEGGMIVVQLPADWQWEVDEITEDAFAMGISFRPGTETEGWLRLQYWPGMFAVCGTGLEEKTLELPNGQKARIGYYDGSSDWSFINFYEAGNYVAISEGVSQWWDAYGETAMEILKTAKLGEETA